MSDSDHGQGVDLGADGIPEQDLRDGEMVAGKVGGDSVLLVRRGTDVFAIGATCSHYGGPLAEGVFDGDCVRCPLASRGFRCPYRDSGAAPALNPVGAYEVVSRDGRLYVGSKLERTPTPPAPAETPESVVIVGGGAAGSAAAMTLRDEGYGGPVTIINTDESLPYDRPNLSKDYLAGNAPEDWLPLWSPESYAERNIEILSGRRVTELDAGSRQLTLADGSQLRGGAILLATGADPVRLDLPGSDRPHVHYLRSVADSRAIIDSAKAAKVAVVVGASFIGLEVAASLVSRGLEVHVVAPEDVPMARILGPELGAFVRALHEEHSVRFHLEKTVTQVNEDTVTLNDGSTLEAGLVVFGVGVRPAIQLAEAAGLKMDPGVLVNEYLETSAPGIFAAGDIARWPDPHSGQDIRVEHWVVAQRQGQTAARNILGRRERFDSVPFFWSQHYDVPINYVGHAEGWDQIDVSGSIHDRDCVVAYRRNGKTLAVASIYRDVDSLRAELAMERGDTGALAALVPRQ